MNKRRISLARLVGFSALTAALVWAAGAATWGREDILLLDGAVLASFLAAAPLPSPAYSADGVIYGVLGAASLLVAGKLCWMLLRGLWQATSLLMRGRRPVLGEAGQAMTEVAISFPILLITTLILMQLALMFQARNIVTYAAFSAARAAIVWIPAENGVEGPNQINESGEKFEKIQQAAAMACIPISPRATTVLGPVPFLGDIIAQSSVAFTALVSVFGLPSSYASNALERYAYSSIATSVLLYRATENGFVDGFGEWTYPRDPADVAVEVRHNFYLSIPVVNRIIGGPFPGTGFGAILPGRYTRIRSVAVLPLEGTTGNPPISGFWDN